MTKTQMQSMAYKLTIEYVRVHPEILSCDLEGIGRAVDKIAEINAAFYDALSINREFDKVYL